MKCSFCGKSNTEVERIIAGSENEKTNSGD